MKTTDETIPETIEETVEPKEEKSEWQIKAEEYLNDLKRVQADFENYKKRLELEQKDLSARLARNVVSDLIPILDNLHSATDHVPAEAKDSPWVIGITYIEKQFEDVLKSYGVEPIEPKPGASFDPTLHEAIDHNKESETEGEHQIEKLVQKGYKIGARVIKAARVIVK